MGVIETANVVKAGQSGSQFERDGDSAWHRADLQRPA